MTNAYFDTPNYTPLARLTSARAEAVDAIITAIVTGFSLLPTPTQIKEGTINFVATDTGAANAYVISLPYAPLAYDDGLEIIFRPALGNTNTGASTINVNGLGVIGLRDYAGNALTVGAVLGLGLVQARFDATGNYFRIMSPNVANTSGVIIGVTPTVAGTSNQITSTLSGTTYTLTLPSAVTFPGTTTTTGTATFSALATFNAGLSVPAGVGGSTMSTTNIAGLTATLTGTLAGNGKTIDSAVFKTPKGVLQDLGTFGGTTNVDLTAGTTIIGTINAATMIVFTNYPTSGIPLYWDAQITLDGSHTVTFFKSATTAVDWPVSGAPTFTASKENHVFFKTRNGGSTVPSAQFGAF